MNITRSRSEKNIKGNRLIVSIEDQENQMLRVDVDSNNHSKKQQEILEKQQTLIKQVSEIINKEEMKKYTDLKESQLLCNDQKYIKLKKHKSLSELQIKKKNKVNPKISPDNREKIKQALKDTQIENVVLELDLQKQLESVIVNSPLRKRAKTDGTKIQKVIKFKENTIQKKEQQHKSVWQKNAFQIIGLVNRFKFIMKKSSLFVNPQKLSKIQLKIINDLSSKGHEDGWGVQTFEPLIQSRKEKGIIKSQILKVAKFFKKCFRTEFFYQLSQVMDQINQLIPVFHSHSKIVWMIDSIFDLFCVAMIIYIPFFLSFIHERSKIEIYLVNTILPLVFLLNGLVSVNSSFFQSGILIKNRTVIFSNYFATKFVLDLSIILILFFKLETISEFSLILFMMIFLKFTENQESFDFIHNKIEFSIKLRSIRDLLTLFAKILYFNHIFASIVHYVAQLELQNGNPNWLSKNGLENASINERYITSFYFGSITMCTVGFGDIVPQSYNERICLSILTLISSGIYGYTLTSIGNILMELSKREKDHQIYEAELNQYMKQHDVDDSLQNQARKYIQFVHNENLIGQNFPGKCLESLSENLREDIVKSIFLAKIKQIPFLKQNFTDTFLEKLAMKVKEKILGPGDILYQCKQKLQPNIIVVGKGSLEVFISPEKYGDSTLNSKREETIIKVLKVDDYYGQFQFFTNQCESIFSVRSVGISTIFYFQLDDFKEILNYSPFDQEAFCNLKDASLFSQDFSPIDISCLSCQASDHYLNTCPYMVYGGDQYQTFEMMNKQEAEFRKNWRRKSVRTLSHFKKDIDTHRFQKVTLQGVRYRRDNMTYINSYYQVFLEDELTEMWEAIESEGTSSENIIEESSEVIFQNDLIRKLKFMKQKELNLLQLGYYKNYRIKIPSIVSQQSSVPKSLSESAIEPIPVTPRNQTEYLPNQFSSSVDNSSFNMLKPASATPRNYLNSGNSETSIRFHCKSSEDLDSMRDQDEDIKKNTNNFEYKPQVTEESKCQEEMVGKSSSKQMVLEDEIIECETMTEKINEEGHPYDMAIFNNNHQLLIQVQKNNQSTKSQFGEISPQSQIQISGWQNYEQLSEQINQEQNQILNQQYRLIHQIYNIVLSQNSKKRTQTNNFTRLGSCISQNADLEERETTVQDINSVGKNNNNNNINNNYNNNNNNNKFNFNNNIINNNEEEYSFNNDIDKVQSFQIYNIQSNIDNIQQILEKHQTKRFMKIGLEKKKSKKQSCDFTKNQKQNFG